MTKTQCQMPQNMPRHMSPRRHVKCHQDAMSSVTKTPRHLSLRRHVICHHDATSFITKTAYHPLILPLCMCHKLCFSMYGPFYSSSTTCDHYDVSTNHYVIVFNRV